jgi:hypothetical protein
MISVCNLTDLSPFFNKGFITEYFNLAGKTPLERDQLQMYDNGELIKGMMIFSIFTEISS